jgi:hypothetical protein
MNELQLKMKSYEENSKERREEGGKEGRRE